MRTTTIAGMLLLAGTAVRPPLVLGVAGDTCATATVIPWSAIRQPGGFVDDAVTGTTDNAPASCGPNGSESFYSFVASADECIFVTTCDDTGGSPGDTILSLKTGGPPACPLGPLACNDDTCNLPGANPQSSTLGLVQVVNGTFYTIQVDNSGALASISYRIRIGIRYGTFWLYESPEKRDMVGTNRRVGAVTATPHAHTPASPPLLYYQLADDCAHPRRIFLVKDGIGPGVLIHYEL